MSKVDSNDAFIHMWYIWRFVGVYPTTKFKWLYKIYAISSNFIADVLAPFSMIVNIFILRDLSSIVRNLQITPTLIVASLKHFLILFRMSTFYKAKIYLNELDERANLNEEEVQYLRVVIRQCHRIVYVFAVALFFSWLSYAAPGLIYHKLAFEGYLPFDWNSSTTVFALVLAFQSLSCAFQCCQNTTSDAYPSLYMKILIAHYHVLGMRVERIGTDPRATSEDNYKELKACINDHKNVTRLFDTIRPVISESVLIQFIITAFVLCLANINFVLFESDSSTIFTTLMYSNGILIEAFPVCYFGNDLMAETDKFTTAIYSCNWIDQSIKFRKTLIIFMQRSQKPNIILAGGLASISLQTFLSIIRFSFSMFTLLSQLQS